MHNGAGGGSNGRWVGQLRDAAAGKAQQIIVAVSKYDEWMACI